MEQMPQVDRAEAPAWPRRISALPSFGPPVSAVWRDGLPELTGPFCTLRELALEDAKSLLTNLTTEEVARFISPPPTSVAGFETFIAWAHRQRSAGRYVCYGIVPTGGTKAVGLFQVAFADPNSTTAEWGFVLGSKYWGSGIFLTGARRVLRMVFTVLGVERLEARAVPANGRGNSALRKTGAIKEGILRGSLERFGERFDQFLWVITRERWSLFYRTRDVGSRRTSTFGEAVAGGSILRTIAAGRTALPGPGRHHDPGALATEIDGRRRPEGRRA